MKTMRLLLAFSSVVGAAPLIAKSELETLRSLCAEQERQIRQLEDENAKLRSLNGLTATRSGDKASHPIAQTAAPAATAQPAAAKAGKTYAVKDGETLSSIGRKFGISTATLIAANPDVKPSAMRPGLVINLGMPAATAKPAPAQEPAATPEKPASTKVIASVAEKAATPVAPARQVPSPLPPAKPTKPAAASASTAAGSGTAKKPAETAAAKPNLRSVTIDGTTTYGEFAAKHGTTVSRLNDLNALELVETTVLAQGSELYVPAQP